MKKKRKNILDGKKAQVKILWQSGEWWCTFVIPATWEAKEGGSQGPLGQLSEGCGSVVQLNRRCSTSEQVVKHLCVHSPVPTWKKTILWQERASLDR